MEERHPDLKKTVEQIAMGLGLTFAPEDEPEGEVCFANNPGLRPEFKQTYTATDLRNYIYAVSHFPACYQQHQELLTTKDAVTFWSIVEAGAQAR